MVSKALVVGSYQRKLEEIARYADIELVAVVPPSWRDSAGEVHLERLHPEGYQLEVSPISMNGSFHLFFFPGLPRLLDRHGPDILHVDEEPYNLATFLAMRAASHRRVPCLFFSWQNLARAYPPPFRWMERWVYRSAAWAIAGTKTAADVLRRKGYHGSSSVIPQFGVDPDIYRPAEVRPDRPFTIGFAGRLVPEKGVDLLVDACAHLNVENRLVILGAGPMAGRLRTRIHQHGLAERATLLGPVPSGAMPGRLRGLDALVLPSRTRPNWSEQFGRVLVDAMACGVPVVGSTSGEIPSVVGDAGLIFPEGDVDALVDTLSRLAGEPGLREDLATRGRQRVLDHYTHQRIAADTVAVYQEVAHTKARDPGSKVS